MSESAQWNSWSTYGAKGSALQGYDDEAVFELAKALGERLVCALPTYEVVATLPEELFPGRHGPAYYCFTRRDLGRFKPTLAWIHLSLFGDLARVGICRDPELMTGIRRVLGDFGLKYVPNKYVDGKEYDGMYRYFVGPTWVLRWFAMVVRHAE